MAAALSKLRSADSAYAQTAMAMARATFVIDFFVRKIFGWRVSNSMTASFAPDAFKPAICRRRSAQDGVIPTPGPQHAALFILCSEHSWRNSASIPRPAENRPPIRAGSLKWMGWNAEQRHLAGRRRPAPTKWRMHTPETEGT